MSLCRAVPVPFTSNRQVKQSSARSISVFRVQFPPRRLCSSEPGTCVGDKGKRGGGGGVTGRSQGYTRPHLSRRRLCDKLTEMLSQVNLILGSGMGPGGCEVNAPQLHPRSARQRRSRRATRKVQFFLITAHLRGHHVRAE